ncbi:hypothetical protein LCGC14_2301840, partial [marine sediment metagenome]
YRDEDSRDGEEAWVFVRYPRGALCPLWGTRIDRMDDCGVPRL